MEESKKKNISDMSEEEVAAYHHEVIETNLGRMTRKEYDDLMAPERRINEGYKNNRYNELFGSKPKSQKNNKGRDMER